MISNRILYVFIVLQLATTLVMQAAAPSPTGSPVPSSGSVSSGDEKSAAMVKPPKPGKKIDREDRQYLNFSAQNTFDKDEIVGVKVGNRLRYGKISELWDISSKVKLGKLGEIRLWNVQIGKFSDRPQVSKEQVVRRWLGIKASSKDVDAGQDSDQNKFVEEEVVLVQVDEEWVYGRISVERPNGKWYIDLGNDSAEFKTGFIKKGKFLQ